MAESFMNINTVRNLNLCTSIPLPLFRLMVANKLQTASGQPPKLQHQQILSIFKHERVPLTSQQLLLALGTLEVIFKIALINSYTLKALSSLFKENTLLDDTYTQILLEQFQAVQQATDPTQICPKLKKFLKMNWNIFNCKSDREGNPVNKMYVKLELMFTDTSTVMFMTLPQFKTFIEEVRLLGSNVTK